jgi:hypothetical protein
LLWEETPSDPDYGWFWYAISGFLNSPDDDTLIQQSRIPLLYHILRNVQSHFPDHPAIRVSHPGRKYTIGGPQEKYLTFRDAIASSLETY